MVEEQEQQHPKDTWRNVRGDIPVPRVPEQVWNNLHYPLEKAPENEYGAES